MLALHIVSGRANFAGIGNARLAVASPPRSAHARGGEARSEPGDQAGVTSTSTQRFSPWSLLSKVYGNRNSPEFEESFCW